MDVSTLAKLVVALLALGSGAASVLPDSNHLIAPKYVDYLTRYGYLDGQGPPTPSAAELRDAVETMQRFFGLEVTGEVDEATAETMDKPRCGVEDVQRQSRYSYICNPPCKWDDNDITYLVGAIPKSIDEATALSVYRKAFGLWAAVTPLSFTKVTEKAMIRIKAAGKYHAADQYVGEDPNFDGPGGVAGHAFSPGPKLGGDVHLDNSETFTDGVAQGTNLLGVFTHELGHALGLGHSTDSRAIMYPTVLYNPTQGDLQLAYDDILGIQYLYGSR